MKIVKRVLLVAAIIIAIPLIAALFLKKDYSVECEIMINKPKQEVFDYVKYLKNQNEYSKWGRMDPNMKTTYVGEDGMAGFIFKWEGNAESGKGEEEIKKIINGERIDYELRFTEPMTSTFQSYMITESVSENVTNVKWGMTGRMNYPMNLMLLFIDTQKMLGDDFNTGLLNLKNKLEG